MSYYYKADEVRKLAANNWLFILATIAPEISDAIRNIGRHITCPIHGGKKDFRLFKDAHLTGGGICNSQGCGAQHDGFELLMWLKNEDFQSVLLKVGDFVRAEKHFRRPPNTQSNVSQKPAIRTNVTNQPVAQPEAQQVESLNEKPRFSAKGELVEKGTDNYRHDKDKEKSYFAKLKNQSGYVKTVWGTDIERVLAESNVAIGDVITLNNLGRKAVTITREICNAKGDVINEEQISTHKNTWEVINHTPDTAVPVQPTEIDAEQLQVESNSTPKDLGAEAAYVVADVSTEHLECSVPTWIVEAQLKAEENAKRRKVAGERAQAYHLKFWDECVGLDCDLARPAHLYLESRKILTRFNVVSKTNSIRFHPHVPYYDEDGKISGHHPAIVCAIRDVNDQIVTLHRTYLGDNGTKADVEDARKMMTVPDGLDVNGCSIPLGQPIYGVMGIAEGLETAWSAYKATGIPTWSTVNAQLMKTFEMPDGVHTLIIWADRDRSKTGEIAAQVLKLRLEADGYNVLVLLPKSNIPANAKGVDWNDILCTQGIIGFPPTRMLTTLLNNLT